MRKRNSYLATLIIVATTVGVYWQTCLNDFINFDDPHYVTENPYIKDGLSLNGVIWAFTSTFGGNWHPLTWLSHMLDIQLFGLNPGAHHLVSVLLHTANALLLFAFLARSTGAPWRSCCVSLLFALHPLHVESVAWIAERKDVLAAFFMLIALLAYRSYAHNRTLSRYLLVVGAFILGLMSKPTVITLPFLLILLDYWPLGRLRPAAAPGIVSEKLPLFALSAVSAFITFEAQKSGETLNHFSLWHNAGNAILAYCAYLEKTFWPSGLAVIYPFDVSAITPWAVAGAALGLVVVSLVAILDGRKRPYLTMGWLWYVGSLVPMIGLIRVGSQSMADRYTYIPLIGVFMVVVWGVFDLMEKRRYRNEVLAVSAGAVVATLSVVTWFQIGYWRNSVTLFSHAVEVTHDNWLAHNNLGTALLDSKPMEAMIHFLEVVRINPGYAIAHNNIGVASYNLGNFQEAVKAYKIALLLDPGRVDTRFNLGVAYYALGNDELALAEYQALKKINEGRAQDLLRIIGNTGR